MNLFTTIYVSAAACAFLLSLVHLSLWLRHRSDRAFLLAAVMSAGAGTCAISELGMVRAETAAEFQSLILLNNLAIAAIITPLVWFLRLRLKAGRKWLAWTISLAWAAGLAISFALPGNITFAEVTEIHWVTAFWGEAYAVPTGVLNPWKPLVDLTVPLATIFAADASVSAWRQGMRRESLRLGGAVLVFIIAGGANAMLADAGILRVPFMISLSFVGIMLALTFDLVDDVSRAAAMSRRLDAQRRRWSTLVERAPMAVVRVGADGVVRGANPFAARLTGRAETSLRGAAFAEIGPAELGESGDEARKPRRAARHGLVASDGSRREILWITAPMQGEDGGDDGFLAIGEDVSEQVRAREEADGLRREMEKLTRAVTLGELASALAHELSQPVAAVLANAQSGLLLLQRGAGGAEAEVEGEGEDALPEVLRDIRADSRRAGAIIDRIRSMMFNEAPRLERFELGAAIGEVIAMVENDAAARGVRLLARPPEAPVELDAARLEVQQVMMNLLLNAVQAMSGPGARQGAVEARWWGDGDRAVIVVDDAGPGIDPAIKGEIFHAFTTTRPGGMGIGLAVSRRIVERHGGRIEAGASPSGGARFSFVLPAAEEAVRARSA